MCVKQKKLRLYTLEPRVYKNFILENLTRLQTSFSIAFCVGSCMLSVCPSPSMSVLRFVSFRFVPLRFMFEFASSHFIVSVHERVSVCVCKRERVYIAYLTLMPKYF